MWTNFPLIVAIACLTPDVSYASPITIARRFNLGDLLGNLLGGAFQTISQITSQQQAGNSQWGTWHQKSFPIFRSDGGTKTPGGLPWGKITTYNANPYQSAPDTGVLRSYDFTLAPCQIRPDGVVTSGAVCINGQFPGPAIEANYGDTISVMIRNKIPNEGTSMHWHGMLQTDTNWEDGVPGVTQCPIAPGYNYRYEFKATLYGSSWYHTHYSAQYAGGAVGPMIIYGPAEKGVDIDLGPVMLMEWYRKPYNSYVQNLLRPLKNGGPILPAAESNLINGRNVYDCKKTSEKCDIGQFSRFNFTSGKTHKLRLMNTGSGAIQKFAIDGHKMQVIANDYMPIEPYETEMVTLGVGQRADVIVKATGKPTDSYWMRTNIAGCSINDGKQTEALAVIDYEKADTKKIPTGPANSGPAAVVSPMTCGNEALSKTVPSFKLPADPPSHTEEMILDAKSNGTHIVYNLGRNNFRANFGRPLLAGAINGTIDEYDKSRNLYNFGSYDTIRIIVYNYNDAPHPMHMHGHNMQILNLGFGKWDGTIIRPSNPQRRDVQIMPPGSASRPSFVVLQWKQDNPGVWPLHCHFAWHSGMGLVANIVERPKDILKWRNNPQSKLAAAGTCVWWDTYTGLLKEPLDLIDSGL